MQALIILYKRHRVRYERELRQYLLFVQDNSDTYAIFICPFLFTFDYTLFFLNYFHIYYYKVYIKFRLLKNRQKECFDRKATDY